MQKKFCNVVMSGLLEDADNVTACNTDNYMQY